YRQLRADADRPRSRQITQRCRRSRERETPSRKDLAMKRFALILASLTIAVGVLAPGIAAADVNDFTVTDFTADYYLSRDDPQGQMRVVEKISVAFTDNNHGIFRAIPESYKGHSVRLHINTVSSDS